MTENLLPHLACDAVLDKLKFPLWGMPKLDGVRGLNLTGPLIGRSLESHANVFATERYSKPEYIGIDGELCLGDITRESLCRDTSGFLTRQTEKPGKPIVSEDLCWWAFDYLRAEVLSKPYYRRYEALEKLVLGLARPALEIVPYVLLESVEDVLKNEIYYLSQGLEGMIIRDPEGMHKSGRATANECNYLRRKPWVIKEALVMEIEEAMQNNNEAKVNALGRTERSSHKENLTGKGMIGTLICKELEEGGGIIRVGPGKMKHKERERFFKTPELILGSVIKYKSLDHGRKDAPRMATFESIRALSDLDPALLAMVKAATFL